MVAGAKTWPTACSSRKRRHPSHQELILLIRASTTDLLLGAMVLGLKIIVNINFRASSRAIGNLGMDIEGVILQLRLVYWTLLYLTLIGVVQLLDNLSCDLVA